MGYSFPQVKNLLTNEKTNKRTNEPTAAAAAAAGSDADAAAVLEGFSEVTSGRTITARCSSTARYSSTPRYSSTAVQQYSGAAVQSVQYSTRLSNVAARTYHRGTAEFSTDVFFINNIDLLIVQQQKLGHDTVNIIILVWIVI